MKKAIVIENQYEKDAEIDGFIKDNPGLFCDVKVLTGALHRPVEEIIGEISKREALIVSSTFMYKDQLEDTVRMLGELDSKHIYVRNLIDHLEDWQKENAYLWFDDYESFISNLIACINKHNIYSFSEEYGGEIQDEVWERMKYSSRYGRGKFNLTKITNYEIT